MISGCSDGNDNNILVISIDRDLKIQSLYNKTSQHFDNISETLSREYLFSIIDKLGEESSKAQKLQIPITTSTKFTSDSNDDLMYMMFYFASSSSSSSLLEEIGFIRFGKRDLYLDDGSSLRHLVNCPCILDFFIRPRRCGYGKLLFDLVLKQLDLNPQLLAYDRPSLSMLSFLKRHYSLDQPLWQHNHFVIFSDIFSSTPPSSLITCMH